MHSFTLKLKTDDHPLFFKEREGGGGGAGGGTRKVVLMIQAILFIYQRAENTICSTREIKQNIISKTLRDR